MYLDTFNNCIRTCSEDLVLKWSKSYVMLIQSFPQLWDFMRSIVFQSFSSQESIPDYKVKYAFESHNLLNYIIDKIGNINSYN